MTFWDGFKKATAPRVFGATVTLTGRSLKGKNRIREWGPDWHVMEERDGDLRLRAATDRSEPRNRVCLSDRWVRVSGDPDFIISDEEG